MSKKRKIFIVGGDGSYGNWMQGEPVSSLTDANLVVFTGGSDVSPEIYGATRHPETSPNPSRDRFEMVIFQAAKALNLPMVGICRGAQFLCVMAGGILVQHQGPQGGRHRITDRSKETFLVTSDHHQAQYPWGRCNWVLLAHSLGLSPYHEDGEKKEMVNNVAPANGIEVEDAYYPDIRALGIQSHPEWQYPPRSEDEQKTIDHYRSLLDKLLTDSI